MIRNVLLGLSLTLTTPALASGYVPFQNDTVFAVQKLTRGEEVQVRDRNSQAIISRTVITGDDGRCKTFRVISTNTEWKACKVNDGWSFHDRSGGEKKVRTKLSRSQGDCVEFEGETVSSPVYSVSGRACKQRSDHWEIRQ